MPTETDYATLAALHASVTQELLSVKRERNDLRSRITQITGEVFPADTAGMGGVGLAAEEPRRVSVLPTPSQHSLFRVAKRSAATVFYSSSNEALLARPRNTIKPLLHSSSPLRLTAETDD